MEKRPIPYKIPAEGYCSSVLGEPFISKSWADPQKAFDNLQRRAEYCKGIVMPDLDTATINVVEVEPHGFNSNDPLSEAKAWAEKNLVGIYTAHKDTLDEFEYEITKSAIHKYLSPPAINKSENMSVHLSVLKTLPFIIEESIEVEIHSDYIKVNGQRSINSPINEKVLIHIFYGCVTFSNSIYRIKTIIKEFSDVKRNNKPYTFEVIKIELLDISSNSILTANGPNSKCKTIEGLSTSTANILQNVEKSYDKGKFLLEETKKHAEIVAEFCKFYFSKEKHSKKP